jgi:hypothetical protein
MSRLRIQEGAEYFVSGLDGLKVCLDPLFGDHHVHHLLWEIHGFLFILRSEISDPRDIVGTLVKSLQVVVDSGKCRVESSYHFFLLFSLFNLSADCGGTLTENHLPAYVCVFKQRYMVVRHFMLNGGPLH